MADPHPKVSVLVITYNQERYISQALDSALMQRTIASFEIVVGEDCSTDRTREILLAYREKHPETIHLLLHPRNLGMNRNFGQTLAACRGKYVAILEGDDYWTSPDKLQRQSDFLDIHPECAASFHNVSVVHDEGGAKDRLFHKPGVLKSFFSLEDILASHFIPTLSVMFRAGLFGEFPEWFYEMPMGDWPLHALNARHGLYGYIDEVLGCYRVHGEGAWSRQGRLKILERSVLAAETINRHFGFAYDAILQGLVSTWKREELLLRSRESGFPENVRYLLEYLRAVPFLGREYRRGVRTFLRSISEGK